MSASIQEILNDNVDLKSINSQSSALKELSCFMSDLMKVYGAQAKKPVSATDSQLIEKKIDELMKKISGYKLTSLQKNKVLQDLYSSSSDCNVLDSLGALQTKDSKLFVKVMDALGIVTGKNGQGALEQAKNIINDEVKQQIEEALERGSSSVKDFSKINEEIEEYLKDNNLDSDESAVKNFLTSFMEIFADLGGKASFKEVFQMLKDNLGGNPKDIKKNLEILQKAFGSGSNLFGYETLIKGMTGQAAEFFSKLAQECGLSKDGIIGKGTNPIYNEVKLMAAIALMMRKTSGSNSELSKIESGIEQSSIKAAGNAIQGVLKANADSDAAMAKARRIQTVVSIFCAIFAVVTAGLAAPECAAIAIGVTAAVEIGMFVAKNVDGGKYTIENDLKRAGCSDTCAEILGGVITCALELGGTAAASAIVKEIIEHVVEDAAKEAVNEGTKEAVSQACSDLAKEMGPNVDENALAMIKKMVEQNSENTGNRWSSDAVGSGVKSAISSGSAYGQDLFSLFGAGLGRNGAKAALKDSLVVSFKEALDEGATKGSSAVVKSAGASAAAQAVETASDDATKKGVFSKNFLRFAVMDGVQHTDAVSQLSSLIIDKLNINEDKRGKVGSIVLKVAVTVAVQLAAMALEGNPSGIMKATAKIFDKVGVQLAAQVIQGGLQFTAGHFQIQAANATFRAAQFGVKAEEAKNNTDVAAAGVKGITDANSHVLSILTSANTALMNLKYSANDGE